MELAAQTNAGGMVSVLGLDLTTEKVAQLCEEASKNTGQKGLPKERAVKFV